jgi:HK97 gp10 family phage protein
MQGQQALTETSKLAGKTHFKGTTVTGVKAVGIEGIDELIAQFNQLGEDAIFRLGPASNEAAEIVANRARSKVPVKSANLYGAIKVIKAGRRASHLHKKYQVFAKVQINNKDAGYGANVELGHKFSGFLWKQADTKRVPEKPFLRPAADESKAMVERILIDAMNEVLKEYGGK